MKMIHFTYEGKNYDLGYTKKTIQMMENAGFNIADIEKKPMIMLPQLFAGAFLLHHKHEDQKVIDRIFESMTDKDGLMSQLIDLYNEPLKEMFKEPEEGNVSWTVS